MAGTGETITYEQLEARANRGAHALRKLGLKNGDTATLALDNRPEFFDIIWAAQRSGVTLVLVSSRLKAEELAYIIQDSGSSALLIGETLAPVAKEILKLQRDIPQLAKVVAIGSIGALDNWSDVCAAQPETPIADEQQGGRMVYSSGTTGRPKGISKPISSGPAVQDNRGTQMLTGLFGLNQDTIYLSPAPLYHAAPMGFNMAIQCLGGTTVIMAKFDPEGYLAAAERYKANSSQVVPTMFIRLLGLPNETKQKYDLSSLRQVIHAAAPCPAPVKRQMIEWFGPIIDEFYAGSEGSGFVMLNSQQWLEHPGSVGRAVMGTIHICDDEGAELPPGEIGTIYFSDGGEFTYHNDEEKTAASRNPKHPAWSTLGDVGRVDKEGYLYLSDRKDFMIISGGVNIYPQEVEDLLIMHPKVSDAAVFGIPHTDLGEEVKAVIQPSDWSCAGSDLEAELIGWCRERLADVKCPRSIDFEKALPRAETGKLHKKELKARYWPA